MIEFTKADQAALDALLRKKAEWDETRLIAVRKALAVAGFDTDDAEDFVKHADIFVDALLPWCTRRTPPLQDIRFVRIDRGGATYGPVQAKELTFPSRQDRELFEREEWRPGAVLRLMADNGYIVCVGYTK